MKKFFKQLAFYLYAGDYSLIYMVILFFTVLVLGYDGIFKGIMAANEKQKVIQEFREVESALVLKDSTMVTTENVLRDYESEISRLNNSITDEVSMEDYLQEIAVAFSEDGFTIQKLSVTKTLDQTVMLNVDLFGLATNLPKLYDTLDKLDRLTVLNTSDTIVDDNETRTSLELNIYYLK